MPTLSELEDWIEQQIPRNLHDLPSKLHESLSIYYESLYHELTRYGSPLPDLSSLGLPSLSQIEESLPFNTSLTSTPPVISTPPGLMERTSDHLSRNSGRYLTSVSIGLGLALCYSYGVGIGSSKNRKGKGREIDCKRASYWFDWRGDRKRLARVERGLRREAVVVLGADTPLGRSLALSLSTSSNLIVLCTISSPSSFSSFESLIPPSSRGYIKALLLDFQDPVSSIPTFIRDIKAALNLRWPSTTAGDPYSKKGEEISLIGIVNCLSYLPDTGSGNELGDLEIDPTNLTQLLDGHVTTPLCVISSLLPFLKTKTSGYLKSLSNNHYVDRGEFELSPTSTVISILPSLSLRVSLPGKLKEGIISKAVSSGMDALRRENLAMEFNQLHEDGEDEMNLGRREIRFSTLTLSAGNAFSFDLGKDSSTLIGNASQSTSSIRSDSSFSNPNRPKLITSGSNSNTSTLSTWNSRDQHTKLVTSKVSEMLLTKSGYRLKGIQNLHLGSEKNFLFGMISRNNPTSTQAQGTTPRNSTTKSGKTRFSFNSRLASFKASVCSIYGSIRNSTLHYLTSLSHFLIEDLSQDAVDFFIALHLSKNKRQIRRSREKSLRELGNSSTFNTSSSSNRRSTIRQSEVLQTPSNTSTPVSSIPSSVNPGSNSNSGSSGSGSEEEGYEIDSNDSQMTASMEFEAPRNINVNSQERETEMSSSQHEDLQRSEGTASQEGSVMGESWVRLNDSSSQSQSQAE